jgi:hypothetical protein
MPKEALSICKISFDAYFLHLPAYPQKQKAKDRSKEYASNQS